MPQYPDQASTASCTKYFLCEGFACIATPGHAYQYTNVRNHRHTLESTMRENLSNICSDKKKKKKNYLHETIKAYYFFQLWKTLKVYLFFTQLSISTDINVNFVLCLLM